MKKNDIGAQSLVLHRKLRGKIEIRLKTRLETRHDLSVIYTPGMATVASAIAQNAKLADRLTWRANAVAVVSDGSAVLGLGNIGPHAALPVMEGKCAIFKRFTGIDAVPIVLATQDVEEIVHTVRALEPSFGAIQLEDISAPRCFEIERRLSEALKVPVMHDDQHGTAIVVLAGLINALKVTRRASKQMKIVLSGAGAAGTAIAKLLHAAGFRHIIVCDRQGAIWKGRKDLIASSATAPFNAIKVELATFTNSKHETGELRDMIKQADVFIGVSSAGLVTKEMVRSMAPQPIIFAMANPIPEIMPDKARQAGAAVVATGRSDFPNQLNNALAYPGLFRGMLDHKITKVTDMIKLRAALSIASFVKRPTPERIIPSIFDTGLHKAVARSVRNKDTI